MGRSWQGALLLLAAPGRVTAAPSKYMAVIDVADEGQFAIEVNRAWAPRGADRFHALVTSGFYNHSRVFRAVDHFMVQFGISGDPKINELYARSEMDDDVRVESNVYGMVTFAAASAPNSRTTQVFVNTHDNTYLDEMGFAPFGHVVAGMDVVNRIYTGYAEATMDHVREISEQARRIALRRPTPALTQSARRSGRAPVSCATGRELRGQSLPQALGHHRRPRGGRHRRGGCVDDWRRRGDWRRGAGGTARPPARVTLSASAADRATRGRRRCAVGGRHARRL